jgi:hypothetical protein
VALEPAWLNGDGAALDGPFCAVGGDWHSAACTKVSERFMWKFFDCGGDLQGYIHCMP